MKNQVSSLTVVALVAVSLGLLLRVEPILSGTCDLTLGWDFECHSHTHPNFLELTEAQIRLELEQVDSAFAAHGYAPPQHHAYPYGEVDCSVKGTVAEYRKSGRAVWGEMMTYPVTDWWEMLAAQLISTTSWIDIGTWVDTCVATRALLHIFTHDVSSSPSYWGCTSTMLVRLLDYLVQKQNAGQLVVMTMAQAYDYWSTASEGKATIVISFDDANESDYTVAYPLFKARGLKGTSYITTDFIGSSGSLTWDQIAEMRTPQSANETTLDHRIEVDGKVFHVLTRSNFSVSDLVLDQSQIRFNVTGDSVSAGYCNVTIPKSLMNCAVLDDWVVCVNGMRILPPNLTTTENVTHTSIYFTCTSASPLQITIRGTYVVPDIPSFLVLPLLIMGTLLAGAICRKSQPRVHERARSLVPAFVEWCSIL